MTEKGQPLTESQTLALAQAVEILQQAFPDLSPTEVLKQHLLPLILGPLPDYSHLKDGYAVNAVTLAAVAASVVCYGDDPETGERVVLVIDRKETNNSGQHYHGLLGGYVNLDAVRNVDCVSLDFSRGEQPSEGAIGEAAEESKDGNNQSIIQLTPDRIELLSGGVNYQVRPPAAYFVHLAELTGAELAALRKHIHSLKNDEAYWSSALRHNDREVFGMHLLNLKEASSLKESEFFYRHTWQALQKALEKIGNEKKTMSPEAPLKEEKQCLIRHNL